MGEPNGKYSVRGVCVDGGEIREWTWCLALRPKSFFFPRNPPDVDGDPADVSAATSSCKCVEIFFFRARARVPSFANQIIRSIFCSSWLCYFFPSVFFFSVRLAMVL